MSEDPAGGKVGVGADGTGGYELAVTGRSDAGPPGWSSAGWQDIQGSLSGPPLPPRSFRSGQRRKPARRPPRTRQARAARRRATARLAAWLLAVAAFPVVVISARLVAAAVARLPRQQS